MFLAVSVLGQGQKIEYSVHGTVRNAVSGEPVKNAVVVLEGIPTSDAPSGLPAGVVEQPQSRAMLTGPAGEFQFQGLSKGQYGYAARKPGYAEDYHSENSGMFALPGPLENSGIQINLAPLGTIEGNVVDQYDEPLENVVLDVYQIAIVDGESRTTNVGTVWTDDLGAFHLAYLAPGKYYVKAQARRGGTETHFGIHTMRYAPWEAFSSVYFGGATDISLATPIALTAGARVRADFRLEMQPSFRIRGKLEGGATTGAVSFELVQNDNRVEPSRALLDPGTGEFEILDVTPGNYTLRAVRDAVQDTVPGKTRGETMVHVAGDVSGVSIVLLALVTVNVSMRPVGSVESRPAGARCEPTLFAQQSPETVYGIGPSENGQVKIPGLFPGEYQVHLHCYGGYPLSASFGDTDLLKNSVLRISADTAPPPIEVEYKLGGGMLKIKFAGQIPSHSAELLVPNFSPSTGPMLQRNPTAERNGIEPTETTLLNLAPGDYTVYGLTQYEYAEFRNPAFLRTLSSGTSVHIEDGKTAEITLASFSQ